MQAYVQEMKLLQIGSAVMFFVCLFFAAGRFLQEKITIVMNKNLFCLDPYIELCNLSKGLTCGMPSAESLAWLKNILPKWSLSGNTSACLGKLAPPESTVNQGYKDNKRNGGQIPSRLKIDFIMSEFVHFQRCVCVCVNRLH